MRTQPTLLTRYPKFLLVITLLGGCGLLLLAIGLFVTLRAVAFHKTAQETTAVITAISNDPSGRGTTTYVDYEVDGKRYEKTPLAYYDSTMKCGDQIEIAYAPQNPTEIRLTGWAGMILPLILLGLGGIYLLIGIVFLVYVIRKDHRRKWLVAYGNAVRAKIVGVRERKWIRFNGRHPYILECVWQENETATPRHFYSDDLRTPPPIGSDVTVYIDPRNDQTYYVDTF